MAITITIGDVIAARFETTDDETRCFNIVHYRVDSLTTTGGLPFAIAPPAADVLPPASQHLYNYFGTYYEDVMTAEVKLANVQTQAISPSPRSRPYVYTPAVPTPGVLLGEALPLQDAITLVKRTPFGQRWGTGRIFISGMPENAQGAGRLTGPILDSLDLLAGAFGSGQVVTIPGGTMGLTPVLYKPATLSPPSPERITKLVDVVRMDNILKTQRRRRPGKGI